MLTGANGTHSVCVCAAHQNVRMVHEGYNVAKLMTHQNTRHYTHHDCVTMMMCSAPQQFFFYKSVQNVLHHITYKIYLGSY